MFLNYFDMLMLKIIFFKKIIMIYFLTKNILKNNYYHTLKHLKFRVLCGSSSKSHFAATSPNSIF